MARTSVPSQFTDDVLNFFAAVDIEFDSGTARIWTGTYDLVINTQTYTGAGQFLDITSIDEDGEISAKGITLRLNGLDSTYITYALTEDYQGRPLTVRVGSIADDGTVSSYVAFYGFMDVMSISERGPSADLSISVESRLIDLERHRIRRYTSEDIKQLDATDKGLDYVTHIQEVEIEWGR